MEIKIEHPHGEMTLVVEKFFPCTIKSWGIVGPLMRDYAGADDVTSVHTYLTVELKDCMNEIRELEDEVCLYQAGSTKYKSISAECNRQKRKRQRLMSNLRMLEKYTGGKK